MRAIGHLLLFLGFFLVFAVALGVLLVGAAVLQSSLVLLMTLPALLGLSVLYVRGYRTVVQRSGSQARPQR
ncbi:MAG TPA: hypothetical protein PLL30_11530 [Candidatus Krumholzibacteria bacterium]|nr:hypothetical protein [Candidatus Krumholzibacteria bacterium]HPD72396.1 hypothetical protein [Candidatus Krumholzibacteria bacterium]HRY40672.1 hypothetical protein [Candidatus Krumholzibacteria bacterium]